LRDRSSGGGGGGGGGIRVRLMRRVGVAHQAERSRRLAQPDHRTNAHGHVRACRHGLLVDGGAMGRAEVEQERLACVPELQHGVLPRD